MATKKMIFINGFALKILAMVFMTLDHIGIFLQNYENLSQIATIFRILGRFSLPIFIYLIVEGVKHTRNFENYIFRLGLLAFVFLAGQLIATYVLKLEINDFTSPILDLITVALFVYFLKKRNKSSLFALIPLLYSILCFAILNTELHKGTPVQWFPFFLRSSYPIYSLLLGVVFYYSEQLSILFLHSNDSTANLDGTIYVRYGSNIISALGILIITTIFYLLFSYQICTYWNSALQIYGCLAMIPIFFYSGERGYNKKWFKYGSYIYVPLHLIIIYVVFTLI